MTIRALLLGSTAYSAHQQARSNSFVVSSPIAHLSVQQHAQIPKWIEEWTQVGLSTEPADWERAEDAARGLYASLKLSQPRLVLRASSPLGASLVGFLGIQSLHGGSPYHRFPNTNQQLAGQRSILIHRVQDAVDSSVIVSDKLWRDLAVPIDQKVSRTTDAIAQHFQTQALALMNSSTDQLINDLKAFTGISWPNILSGDIAPKLSAKRSALLNIFERGAEDRLILDMAQTVSQKTSTFLFTLFSEALHEHLHYCLRCGAGTLLAAWCAYVSFLRDVVGWHHERLKLFSHDEALTRSCGWLWMHPEVCVIGDRPRELHIDTEGRPHSEHGPAIRWADGWRLYAWRGTRVPSQWIEHPESLNPQQALRWPNIEQRRAACEFLGWERILAELRGLTIDADGDPEIGELIEVSVPDIGRARFLRVRCGTGRSFALPVPLSVATAIEANAWTYGFDSREFTKPEVRT